jgi:hypothetical protein
MGSTLTPSGAIIQRRVKWLITRGRHSSLIICAVRKVFFRKPEVGTHAEQGHSQRGVAS